MRWKTTSPRCWPCRSIPAGFPHQYQVAYRQEPRELVVEYRLPPVEVIPPERDFRYVKARREIDELPRPAKEIKELYASVIHQIALRTMWECFAVAGASDVVDAVVFNGIVAATNRATGQAEELHLISAPASRETFAGLVLDQLEPESCLQAPQGDRLPAPLRPGARRTGHRVRTGQVPLRRPGRCAGRHRLAPRPAEDGLV